MKTIRVPWIQCRADEVGAQSCPVEWRRISVTVLAYSETEARSWWDGLADHERDELLGLGDQQDGEFLF